MHGQQNMEVFHASTAVFEFLHTQTYGHRDLHMYTLRSTVNQTKNESHDIRILSLLFLVSKMYWNVLHTSTTELLF